MSRYRKIDPRFWKDEKVMALGSQEKLIALYLFTGQSNRIGIFNFSPGEAAEDLGIPAETFPEGFLEPFGNVCRSLSFKYDERFRVLYLPTWWKYNCPENPNVLKSCLADLHEIPQGPLIAEFSANLQYLPETFHQTFREGLGKPSPQRMPHQEQEQEQEQEQNICNGGKPPRSQSSSLSKKRKSATDPIFDDFYSKYPKHVNREAAHKAWRKLAPDGNLSAKILAALEDQKQWRAEQEKNPKAFIPEWPHPASWINAKRWTDEITTANGAGAKRRHSYDDGAFPEL